MRNSIIPVRLKAGRPTKNGNLLWLDAETCENVTDFERRLDLLAVPRDSGGQRHGPVQQLLFRWRPFPLRYARRRGSRGRRMRSVSQASVPGTRTMSWKRR